MTQKPQENLAADFNIQKLKSSTGSGSPSISIEKKKRNFNWQPSQLRSFQCNKSVFLNNFRLGLGIDLGYWVSCVVSTFNWWCQAPLCLHYVLLRKWGLNQIMWKVNPWFPADYCFLCVAGIITFGTSLKSSSAVFQRNQSVCDLLQILPALTKSQQLLASSCTSVHSHVYRAELSTRQAQLAERDLKRSEWAMSKNPFFLSFRQNRIYLQSVFGVNE